MVILLKYYTNSTVYCCKAPPAGGADNNPPLTDITRRKTLSKSQNSYDLFAQSHIKTKTRNQG